MSEVEAERSALIELEVEQGLNNLELEAKQQELERLIKEVEDRQKLHEQRRSKIAEVRARLEEAERRQNSLDQAGEVSADVERLRRKYTRLAEGKVWWEGTGNDDAILDFQKQGVMFGAAAGRWILGDEPGLGKTRQAIGWLDLVGAKKVLIVCEPNLCDQFAGEVMELAPHRAVFNLYKKSKAARHEMIDTILSMDEAVIVVNYEIWRKDVDFLAKLLDYQLDTIIVDEAHNLKNTATSNFKKIEVLVKADNLCPKCSHNLKGLYDQSKKPRLVPKPCESCGWKKGDPGGAVYNYPLQTWLESKSVKHLCFTTGTPILNSPLDLYSLLHLCDPILFTSARSFKKAFCATNYHSGKTEFRTGGLENLKPLIAGRFLQRTRHDAGIVLPPQHIHIIRVDLDKHDYAKQYRIIRQITEAANIVLESGERLTMMHLLAVMMRKRQANVWPGGIRVIHPDTGEVLFDAGTEVRESVKMDRIAEKIIELHAEGRRQVVFSQFSTGIREFAERLESLGLRVAVLDGDTPTKLSEEIKSNFYKAKEETPKWDILLANYKSGGTGLNLTACTATHIMDEEWNPGKRNQSYGRNDRIGQDEESDVYVYRIPNTIDIYMSNVINRKEKMIEGFNDTMKTHSVKDQIEDFRQAMISGEVL